MLLGVLFNFVLAFVASGVLLCVLSAGIALAHIGGSVSTHLTLCQIMWIASYALFKVYVYEHLDSVAFVDDD
jgi:hypothetical protein